jgi:hypothetical protein
VAEHSTTVKADLAAATFILGVFVCIILWWGEPDLHDAILHRLMGDDADPEAVEPAADDPTG